MIAFDRVTKTFPLRQGGRATVMRELNCIFPTGASVALLGRNGAGKSTMLKMIAGTQEPDSGRIRRRGTVSWPIGFAGSFHPDLTGAQNTRFVARVYGVDTDALIDYVRDFAELGRHFDMPFRTYSAGMKARLAFGVSMGIPFDTYLIDEVTSVGDARFRQKANDVFRTRLANAGAIMASHSIPMLKQNCTIGAVLHDGEITFHDDIDAAIEHHRANMRQ